jgi:ribosomal protein S18 acetylase RimI-like enzyme
MEDMEVICTFPQSPEELFFFFPPARFPLMPEQLAQSAKARTDSTVFMVDGAVGGFANFFRCEPSLFCTIGNLIVAPAFRNKGLARYIVTTMAKFARERHGAKDVRASCFNSNTPGLLFYRKLGFSPIDLEERTGCGGERIVLIHFCKSLQDDLI